MKIENILTITIIISILVVLLLAGIIVPRYFRGIDKLRGDSAIPKMVPIESAIDAYILNTGKLPGDLEDLIVCPEGLESSWKGPYLKESQLHDPWGRKYFFEYGYRLQSYGADGIKGGDNENADIESFTGLIK